jgi:hypothetical protein
MGTDYRSLYDKDYIGAWDLQDRDVNVTIRKVIGGNLVGQGGRKSRKPVIYMNGTEKGFALNATNGKTIAAMYGPLIEGWVGKRITLYKSTTRDPNGGGEVECIRVRPTPPKPKGAAAEPTFAQPPAEQPQQLGEPEPVSLDEALTRIDEQTDPELLALYVDSLPEEMRAGDIIAKAVKSRLDAIRGKVRVAG